MDAKPVFGKIEVLLNLMNTIISAIRGRPLPCLFAHYSNYLHGQWKAPCVKTWSVAALPTISGFLGKCSLGEQTTTVPIIREKPFGFKEN